jgi:uncharacterized pyridoxal phosphate-containing UPF0001 family protein
MHTTLVKIPDNLTEDKHRQLSGQIQNQGIDGIEISYYGGRWGDIWKSDTNYNLDFLKFYKGIRTLRLDLRDTNDASSIAELADSLEYLHLGEFSNKKISYDFIGEMKELKFLSVVRQPNGLESILKLKKLINLNLTGYSADKLDYLNDLKTIKRLYIGFGASTSLDTIDKIKTIEELSILWVKKLSDIKAISKLENLVKLKIEDEKQIKELPKLENLKQLKNIRLMNLNGLGDISTLQRSSVEEIVVTGRNKDIDFINAINQSPSVKRAYTYFYTDKIQSKAESMLGTKFSKLDNMKYEMDNRASLHYYDIGTWKKIE